MSGRRARTSRRVPPPGGQRDAALPRRRPETPFPIPRHTSRLCPLFSDPPAEPRRAALFFVPSVDNGGSIRTRQVVNWIAEPGKYTDEQRRADEFSIRGGATSRRRP